MCNVFWGNLWFESSFEETWPTWTEKKSALRLLVLAFNTKRYHNKITHSDSFPITHTFYKQNGNRENLLFVQANFCLNAKENINFKAITTLFRFYVTRHEFSWDMRVSATGGECKPRALQYWYTYFRDLKLPEMRSFPFTFHFRLNTISILFMKPYSSCNPSLPQCDSDQV